MPKANKSNALRRTRRLLKSVQIKITDSTSESEASSEDSAEFSHIPIDNVPNLENLFLTEQEEKANMDQMIAQMNTLTQAIEAMRLQQQQQQHTIDALAQGQAQASALQNNEQQQNANAAVDVGSLYRIPDPIKSIPTFDGSRKQLTRWLSTAENTLNKFKNRVAAEQYEIFVTAVANKLEGKAKDIICLAGNPQTFEEIKQILMDALGDRQELTFYKSQLWQTKMTDNMTIHKHYNKCKEIIQNIKTLAKQKDQYRNHWDAINAFIEEDALAAFLAGLKEPYFGYAQAAKPEDMEAAYAFVCKFKCREGTSANMEVPQKPQSRFQKYKDQPKFNHDHQNSKKPFTSQAQVDNDPQPMELGSTKSRLTLNRRQINNREITDDENSSESEQEENIDLNFCLGMTTKAET